MSLDVYLSVPGVKQKYEARIFVRDDGQTKVVSRQEWDERFPGREPFVINESESDEVFTANITHNLGQMAHEAGIYKHLWRPEEVGVTKAEQLIKPLEAGLSLLTGNLSHFQKYNPDNGWGSYEGLVDFMKVYIEACKKYPTADVRVSR